MTKINHKEVIDKLMQIEDELNLFNKKIGDIYFWERLRFSVCVKVLLRTGTTGQAHTKIKLTYHSRMMYILSSIRYMFVNNPYFAHKSDILFYGHQRRKKGEDGKWHDLYCDPIIENLDYSYTYIEQPYLGKHLYPTATSDIRYLDFLLFIATLARKLKLVRIKFSTIDIDLIENIKNKIDKAFNINIEFMNIIKYDLLKRKSQLPLFKLLLKKIKPKLIFVVCSYGRETFIEACKMMKIPIAELQHGAIGRNHLGYSFPGVNRTKRAFPDYLLTFSDYYSNVVEYPVDSDKVISIGYPYFEKKMSRYTDYSKKNQVVFISQGSVGKEMSRIAVALSKRTDFSHKIIYKLHPGEYARWHKEYPWLLESKLQVVDNDSYPLYEIFAESIVQLGFSSTALFEGLAFGLKTILLPLGSIEGIQFLIDEKRAVLAGSIDEIISEIVNINELVKREKEIIFKLGALDNLNDFIRDIIGKSGEVN